MEQTSRVVFEGVSARGKHGKPSKRFEVTTPHAKAVREQMVLSQGDFAKLLRVSVKTLLKIVSTAPEVALNSLHGRGAGHCFQPDRPLALSA